MVAKAAAAAGAPAEQPVQRGRVQREQLCLDRVVDVERCRLCVHRLLQARRGLAGRRGERDQRRGAARGPRLLGEQRDDPRDRRRLARARPAGDDGQPPQDRRLRCCSLAVVGLAAVVEQARQPLVQHVGAHAGRREFAERQQVVRDAALLAPVAVEVQAAAFEAQRPRLGLVARVREQRCPRLLPPSSSPRATAALPGRPARPSRPRPCRGSSRGRRRHARAAARARRARRRAALGRSSSPPRRAMRSATWTSAAVSTPASLNGRSRPGALRARLTSNGSGAVVVIARVRRRARR